MNKEWSELNKLMQSQIKKRDTYEEGIDILLALRDALWDTVSSFKEELNREEFNAIPFINGRYFSEKDIKRELTHLSSPQEMNWLSRRLLTFQNNSIWMNYIRIFPM